MGVGTGAGVGLGVGMEATYGTLLIRGEQGEIIVLTCNLNLDMKDINVKDK